MTDQLQYYRSTCVVLSPISLRGVQCEILVPVCVHSLWVSLCTSLGMLSLMLDQNKLLDRNSNMNKLYILKQLFLPVYNFPGYARRSPFEACLPEVSLNYDKMSKFKGTDNPNRWSILLNSRKDGRNKRKKLLKKKIMKVQSIGTCRDLSNKKPQNVPFTEFILIGPHYILTKSSNIYNLVIRKK